MEAESPGFRSILPIVIKVCNICLKSIAIIIRVYIMFLKHPFVFIKTIFIVGAKKGEFSWVICGSFGAL